MFGYRLLTEAIEDVVRAGAEPARTDANEHDSQEGDAAVNRFWRMMLTADESFPPRERLDAFEALDELGALPQCTCKPIHDLHLWEIRLDATRAYIVKIVAQKHYRAAMLIPQFPETFVAVREAIDAELLDRREAAPPAEEHTAA